MKENERKETYKLIRILTSLTVAGLHGLRLTGELRELLRSVKWCQSTITEKHEMLKSQYCRDYISAKPEQRRRMRLARARIEAQLAARAA